MRKICFCAFICIFAIGGEKFRPVIMKRLFTILLMLVCLEAAAQRVYIWPKGKMPDAQPHQYAAMTDVSKAEGFKLEDYPCPYIDWLPAPDKPCGACMILISGGSYKNTCDVSLVKMWGEELTRLGVQCVNLVYRTPRPKGLPIYQSAWEDGQRAVRMVRKEARKRGFDPEKIGIISMSAGSHLGLLLGSSSQTAAYERIDAVDDIPCHINWAVINAPAYVTTDGENGTRAKYEGYGPDVKLSEVFRFDEKTCPMSLHHGNLDPYSPNGSTLVYHRLRKMGVPAELHLYPGKKHGAFGFERAVEFMTQMGFLGPLAPEELLTERLSSDDDRASVLRENVWPEGKIPDFREAQCVPYIEWHFPKELKTTAIQIIYSGGGYKKNNPDGTEVAPIRRYLNAKGMTVVTLKYRTPRPEGLSKHITAWQDLQRTVRIVRSEAASRGLDPDRIGIMGSSAGGHLTLMGTTSSVHQAYLPIDDIDKVSCKVQWGIGIYPAYVLSDGFDGRNSSGGTADGLTMAPEFSFDKNTAPLLLIHGDEDYYASMNSVAVWERMRAIGIDCELHTLATHTHVFIKQASPGTGAYTWMDRVAEFLQGRVL